MSTLTEWLGKGGRPVPRMTAELRGLCCSTCPENREALWWERMYKDPIAAVIRKHLEFKHGLGLKVSMEQDLKMCRVCGCCARLKVWVPKEHLQASLTPAELSKFPAWCWITREQA